MNAVSAMSTLSNLWNKRCLSELRRCYVNLNGLSVESLQLTRTCEGYKQQWMFWLSSGSRGPLLAWPYSEHRLSKALFGKGVLLKLWKVGLSSVRVTWDCTWDTNAHHMRSCANRICIPTTHILHEDPCGNIHMKHTQMYTTQSPDASVHWPRFQWDEVSKGDTVLTLRYRKVGNRRRKV